MRFLMLAALALATGCPTPPPPAEVEYVPSQVAPSDVAAPPADALKTESGLAYKVLKAGPDAAGAKPDATSRVTVHYTGWLTSGGEPFDSSRTRGETAEFPLRGVIAGWTEGLQLMTKGDHFRFWIPEEQAYKGQPGKPAGMLVFDVELVDFKTPPAPVPPPEAPADVAAAPADATTTASGLAWKLIVDGPGGARATEKSMVGVHYAGWTTDGQAFDYSRKRHAAAAFPLSGVIAGWTEGLQLIEVGDTARFWIPEALAYKGQPGKPAGMLVFDVELLAVANPPELTAPAEANTTDDGMKWVLTSSPTGGAKPTETSKTTVNWAGWSTDGTGLLSNLAQDPVDPTPFARQLPALQKAVGQLAVGESGRFWIPEELAFKGNPRAPKGGLVFDIELVSMVEGPPKPAATEPPHDHAAPDHKPH